MRSVILILAILLSYTVFSQTDHFYLYDENAKLMTNEEGQLSYILSVKSKDERFLLDGYKFVIPNRKGFDEYKSVIEMRERVDLDSLSYSTVEELAKLKPCKLHEFFSLQKKSFLIYLSEKRDYVKGDTIRNYYKVPIYYNGTQKNIEGFSTN